LHLISGSSLFCQDDWIEPEWSQTFVSGVVPVYIGAPNIHSFSPGPRSFIHIRDFSSGRQLWDYLKSFEEGAVNADKYNEFHRWREGVSGVGAEVQSTHTTRIQGS
jgi:hypothetical protein